MTPKLTERDIQITVSPLVGGIISTVIAALTLTIIVASVSVRDTVRSNAAQIALLNEATDKRPTYDVVDLMIGRLRDRVDSLEGRVVDLRDQMRKQRGALWIPYRREYWPEVYTVLHRRHPELMYRVSVPYRDEWLES